MVWQDRRKAEPGQAERERQRNRPGEQHRLELAAPRAIDDGLCYDGAATVEVANTTACDRTRQLVGDLGGRRRWERRLGGVGLVLVATVLTGVLTARSWDTARY